MSTDRPATSRLATLRRQGAGSPAGSADKAEPEGPASAGPPPRQQRAPATPAVGPPAPATTAATSAPKPVTDSEQAGLLALLKCEADARATATSVELQFLAVNEARKFTRARQAFLFRGAAAPRVVAISDLAAVDSSSALVMALESAAPDFMASVAANGVAEIDLSRHKHAGGPQLASYPFRMALWVPMDLRKGQSLGGLLLTREQPWSEAEIALAKRLAGTFAHALALHVAERNVLGRFDVMARANKKWALGASAAALAAMLFPVSMTTLAPFEIVPHDPFVVAASIEGVIEQALVEPNSEVKAGQPLVRFTDTLLRNRLEVAEREVQVAEAQTKQATQLGFDQVEGRNSVALASAEHELKAAERNAARDMLARATIVAPRSGVALYHDKGALAGKPVALGERIMLIADPAKVEVAADVAVGDALILKPGARVKVFLDSDPLNPREAKVESADYQARVRPGDTLAFRVIAQLDGDEPLPRLGVRGTAQLYGERVPLGFYLFRRPVTAMRQWIGL